MTDHETAAVAAYEKVARRQARKLSAFGEYEDLAQEGRIGIVLACRIKRKPEVAFSTHVYRSVRTSIYSSLKRAPKATGTSRRLAVKDDAVVLDEETLGTAVDMDTILDVQSALAALSGEERAEATKIVEGIPAGSRESRGQALAARHSAVASLKRTLADYA